MNSSKLLKKSILSLAVVFGVSALSSLLATAAAPAAPAPPAAAPAGEPLKLLEPKPLTPDHKVVILFPPGHPALRAGIGSDKEEQLTGQPGRISAVRNVHNPSIELYLADKPNGVSVILSAGGANTSENVGPEGTQVAAWLNKLGISCFVHRYRLTPGGYKPSVDALLDTQRAVRTIRANAKEWKVDPNKIGHMGFSAGGEQSARLELNYDKGNPDAADPIDRVSCRPDWVCLVYAGWSINSFDMSKVPADVPPAFMVCAGTDDMFHSKQTVEFYTALSNAGQNFKPNPLNVEMHIYGRGTANPTSNGSGHGGGIGARRGIPYGTWQTRFIEWAADLKLMDLPARDPATGGFPGT